MIKTLVVCKTYSTAKKIVNKILVNIDNIRIVGITETSKETKEILKYDKPDLIITTDSNIVNLVENDSIIWGTKIVLISKDKKNTSDYKHLLVVHYDLNLQDISKEIHKFIKNDIIVSKREKARNILFKLGFSFKLVGTNYLLDSILYVNSYEGATVFEQLKRDIYTYVAEKNNTNSDKVKWSVDRSINYMYKNHTKESYEYVEKYFGFSGHEKPTAKLMINLIAHNINM